MKHTPSEAIAYTSVLSAAATSPKNGSAEPEFPAVNLSEALISLRHLRHNVRAVKRLISSPSRIMAIVKANAYGHTVDAVAPVFQAEGITDFGVANINEAIELRKHIGSNAAILAFASPLAEQLEFYIRHNIELSIGSDDILSAAESIAAKLGKSITAHLKIDTGMGRLGVQPADALRLAERLAASPHLRLKAIYTHFASSGSDRAFTKKQLKTYLALVSEIEHRTGVSVVRHAANSGAILTDKTTHLDMVRPGILLYGYTPDDSFRSAPDLKPAMQLQSRVMFTKWIEKGASVGYGRRWTAARRSRIATVSIGYADGYHRAASNISSVMIRGKMFRQVGSVTMDAMMVNLGNDESVQVGDAVVLFGWEMSLSVNRLAKQIGTIGYELLCAVSPRVKRVVVKG